MSVTLILIAALASAPRTISPDFRQMRADNATALVVDLASIYIDRNGMRNVAVYAVKRTPQESLNHKGKFLYGKFVYLIDCSIKKYTINETVVYSEQFGVLDDIHPIGPIWNDAQSLPLATYCSKKPIASPEGLKLPAADWQSALRISHSRLVSLKP